MVKKHGSYNIFTGCFSHDIHAMFWHVIIIHMLIVFPTIYHRMGGVMVSMLASSALNHWFEPRSGQIKL
jgi:hypothetical protein